MMLIYQEWDGVVDNTQHKNPKPDRNDGKSWVELDCWAHRSDLGWLITPQNMYDDLSN